MTLWGGRFQGEPSRLLWEYTIDRSDRRLLADDVAGSIAHVTMLAETGILPPEDAETLLSGLGQIAREAEAGNFEFTDEDEDVHSAVERRLGELVGEAAGKLHTGRSRNDQVSLDLRLYLTRAAGLRKAQLHTFARAMADLAEEHGSTVIPSFTHMQQAQATSLGHHLLAYAWMAIRDSERFDDAAARIGVSPLGAGASSGSGLPLDPVSAAEHLGLPGVFRNSMDAVGSRDFVAEYAFCCAQAMIHLSRLAEEIILWASSEFGWLSLGDAVSTGSSALPHKRNPDMAELVRGRAGTVLGDLVALLTLQKALPLTYNRDLQEDKAAAFHADDTLAAALDAVIRMLTEAEFHPPPPGAATTSLDLAEALVSRGVPFRAAHELVGLVVTRLEQEGRPLDQVEFDDLAAVSELFEPGDIAVTDPLASLERRRSPGSGNAASVEAQVAELRALTEGSDP